MALAYGMTALISLCMVGLCVLCDKKRDLWLLALFVSVSVCNMGYFMLAISADLSAALAANRIAYLGSVFLPFFMLMMVLRFCEIKRGKWLAGVLVAVGIVMLGITTSPGILPIYYSSVDITFVDGYTKLVREYGPCHLLYYVYLFGYMFSMIGIAFYAIAKKKLHSRLHTVLLVCAVCCNVVIWLVEQCLPRGFEWLSVSYILSECLILLLYQSMQKKGWMDWEGKHQTYTVNLVLSLYLLLFANMIRVVTRGSTPMLYEIAQTVTLLIYLVILVSWAVSAYQRIVHKTIRRYLIVLVVLMLFWFLMRTLRHTVFNHVFPYGQWCWYAFYVSMILIPQISFYAAKYVGKPETYQLPRAWYWMYLPSILLIVGILTNDLHQIAFRFHMGYEIGWDLYQRTVLYYLAVVWIFGCIALMIRELLQQCRVPGIQKTIWLPIAMIGLGLCYTILYTIDSELFGFIEMTAALCFIVVAIWESCIKTGLIPSNVHYHELLKQSDMGITIVDGNHTVHYRSDTALPLQSAQIQSAMAAPILLENGTRISAGEIRGGAVLWEEDVSELYAILEELEGLREDLEGSNALFLQNYQIEKQIQALAEKNRLYDTMHQQTAQQIDRMNGWLDQLMASTDTQAQKDLLRRIVVVGAYLKRRYNLILIHEQEGYISEREFRLSIEEILKNLQLAGVVCGASVAFARDLSTEIAMQFLDFFESVIAYAFDDMQSLLARYFYREGKYYACMDVVCGMDLLPLQTGQIAVCQTEPNGYTLSFALEAPLGMNGVPKQEKLLTQEGGGQGI